MTQFSQNLSQSVLVPMVVEQTGRGERGKRVRGNQPDGQNPLPVRPEAGSEVDEGLGREHSRHEKNPIRSHKVGRKKSQPEKDIFARRAQRV